MIHYLLRISVIVITEKVGFEPTDACTSLVFKTSAINHSTTFPNGLQSPTASLYASAFVPDTQVLHGRRHYQSYLPCCMIP